MQQICANTETKQAGLREKLVRNITEDTPVLFACVYVGYCVHNMCH